MQRKSLFRMMSKSRGKRQKDDKKTEIGTLYEDSMEEQTYNTSAMLTRVDTSHDDSPILAAIQSMRNEFSAQLHKVVSSNREIKEAIGTFSERLTEAETRISTVEDQIASLETLANATQKKVQNLNSQMEESENRRRRCNLRLVALPEGAENGDARTFLMTWLPTVLHIEAEQPLTIEQAYRLGKSPQKTQDQDVSDQARSSIDEETLFLPF